MSPFRLAVGFSIGMLVAHVAIGAPPPGADPSSALSRWIKTLIAPNGNLCCSDADCRHTSIEQRPDGSRWAWIGVEQFGAALGMDEWRRVSDDVWNGTRSDGDPPDGRAYVCFWGDEVRCAKSAGGS